MAIRFLSCQSCELQPFWAAAMRFLLASVLFTIIAVVMRAGLPRGRALWGAVLYGALQFGVGLGLVYWGLVRAPAGHGQVLLASVPLLTFLLALVQRQERFRWDGLAGAGLVLAGIAVIFHAGLTTGVPLASLAAILAGAFCFAEALIVVKGFADVHPAAINAIAMGVGAVVLLLAAAAFGETFTIPTGAVAWGAQAYLVLAGSIGVFWLYVIVLRGWTASAAAYELVLMPLVTVVLAALLQGERFAWSFAVGLVLVVGGVYVGALRHKSLQAGHHWGRHHA